MSRSKDYWESAATFDADEEGMAEPKPTHARAGYLLRTDTETNGDWFGDHKDRKWQAEATYEDTHLNRAIAEGETSGVDLVSAFLSDHYLPIVKAHIAEEVSFLKEHDEDREISEALGHVEEKPAPMLFKDHPIEDWCRSSSAMQRYAGKYLVAQVSKNPDSVYSGTYQALTRCEETEKFSKALFTSEEVAMGHCDRLIESRFGEEKSETEGHVEEITEPFGLKWPEEPKGMFKVKDGLSTSVYFTWPMGFDPLSDSPEGFDK